MRESLHSFNHTPLDRLEAGDVYQAAQYRLDMGLYYCLIRDELTLRGLGQGRPIMSTYGLGRGLTPSSGRSNHREDALHDFNR